MLNRIPNPNTLKLIDTQRQHVEALAHTAPGLHSPIADHLRAVLDVVSTRKEPEVENLCEWVRNRLNAEH
jgi:hypothetical protein